VGEEGRDGIFAASISLVFRVLHLSLRAFIAGARRLGSMELSSANSSSVGRFFTYQDIREGSFRIALESIRTLMVELAQKNMAHRTSGESILCRASSCKSACSAWRRKALKLTNGRGTLYSSWSVSYATSLLPFLGLRSVSRTALTVCTAFLKSLGFRQDA
jgi:hypothetical protein